MHSKSNNIETIINYIADENFKQHFKSLQNKYQDNVKKMMTISEFVFDYVHLLYYKYHKINPNVSGSYKDSADWVKNK